MRIQEIWAEMPEAKQEKFFELAQKFVDECGSIHVALAALSGILPPAAKQVLAHDAEANNILAARMADVSNAMWALANETHI